MSKSPASTPTASNARADDPGSPGGLRETVESIIIAFVLAFLFRSFEAEAFVIPTGSMAPTLMGAHNDVACPQCGITARVGVSESKGPLEYGKCPNCRYPIPLGKAATIPPTYSGDRIIVNKFAYEISDPSRWDVAVFKYPHGAATNYIKRVVGLPNERLRIRDGDISTAPLEGGDFQIQRKPPQKVLGMMQPVHDNDYPAGEALATLTRRGLPPRWRDQQEVDGERAWQLDGTSGWRQTQFFAWKPVGAESGKPDYSAFETVEPSETPRWLVYEHLLPSANTWSIFVPENDPQTSPVTLAPSQRSAIKPRLIEDFYAYNDGSNTGVWVGDLALLVEVESLGDGGQVALRLIEGTTPHTCTIDLATGQATLDVDGLPDWRREAATGVKGRGKYELAFANVDDQLLLWVDGQLVAFAGGTEFPSRDHATPSDPGRPVQIGALGDARLRIRHLRVTRDVYYLADRLRENSGARINDTSGGQIFRLDAGQYFMLGDNSPSSSDGRLWDQREYFVARELFIGKALWVYWPHALSPNWAITVFGWRLPFYPNFPRMRFVH